MTIKLVEGYQADNHTIRLIIQAQSVWRGHLVRKNFVAKNLYALAIQYIKDNPEMKGVPRAASGITPVFVPEELPIIFKALGKEKVLRRFFTMWSARLLCIKNGYEHLLIPRAHPYDKYNIEDKLPVHKVTQREQIALYEDNKDKFTAVVKEFTGFLCQTVFPDILTYFHPYLQESKIPLGRCDNLPLLIQDGVGKIALIDLGGLEIRKNILSVDEAVETAKTAIYIFPYHFVEIMQVIYAFCPEIKFEINQLEAICAKTITNFKSIYADHKEFIQNERCYFCAYNSALEIAKLKLVSEEVVKPILIKLVEISMKPTQDFNQRMITIKILNKDIESQAEIICQIMKQLIERNTICYANLYFNRSKELCLRVHY